MRILKNFTNPGLFLLLCFLPGLMLSCRREKGEGTSEKPEANRFTKIVLEENLDEPIMFQILEDNRVLVAERKGKIKVIDLSSHEITVIADIPVSVGYYDEAGEELSPTGEDGMLGMILDPDFKDNHWIYLFYSPQGGKHRSILARYEWSSSELDMDSEKILLEVPNQRRSCCHLGGGMLFDNEGNLYLTTGDNSFGTLDETPGSIRDGQNTSANTNDLRGKILRIHPEPDGSYTIPDGNLFPEGMDKTRPEIYTMGNRNPWRLSIDSETGWLYWGEVGPGGTEDIAGVGPRSYDEFNQAREAGNYGWPHFSANNQAYWRRDYTTGESMQKFDSLRPKNLSPNNTGLVDLPPPQPAFIWYPQTESKEFPMLGSGSNSAAGGPIYHVSDFENPARPFPAYYEGKWFITDWVRGWIMVVSFDEHGNYESMEPFLPDMNLTGPIDMKFGPDGDLYILEYGRKPYEYSPEARFVKIEYNKGNRRPVASMSADKTAGAVPLNVRFNSSGTMDHDNDGLSHEWRVTSNGKTLQTFSDANPDITFSEPGQFRVSLVVRDPEGAMDSSSVAITAGNDPPSVKINYEANKTFFFVGDTISYSVDVSDTEDGNLSASQIAPAKVGVSVDYFNADGGFPGIQTTLMGIDALIPVRTVMAQGLMGQSDCYTCHKVDGMLLGPSFHEIAKKYQNTDDALNYLKRKIMFGGSGVWEGHTEMPPHPTLTDDAVSTIAKYILNLKDKRESDRSLPVSGKYVVTIPQGEDYSQYGTLGPSYSDKFVFRASYTDKGTEVAPPQSGVDILVLRNPTLAVVEANVFEGVDRSDEINPNLSTLNPRRSGSYIGFNQVDLTGIQKIEFETLVAPKDSASGWMIEIRIDSPTGRLIGKTAEIRPTQTSSKINTLKVEAGVAPTSDMHDIYFVFVNAADDGNRVRLRSIRFGRG